MWAALLILGVLFILLFCFPVAMGYWANRRARLTEADLAVRQYDDFIAGGGNVIEMYGALANAMRAVGPQHVHTGVGGPFSPPRAGQG
jgi:hypothetical protein